MALALRSGMVAVVEEEEGSGDGRPAGGGGANGASAPALAGAAPTTAAGARRPMYLCADCALSGVMPSLRAGGSGGGSDGDFVLPVALGNARTRETLLLGSLL
jgi:hypothetical protein